MVYQSIKSRENVYINWEEEWYLPRRVSRTTHRRSCMIRDIANVSERVEPSGAIKYVALDRVGELPPTVTTWRWFTWAFSNFLVAEV